LEVRTDDERNTTMAEDRMAVLEMLRKASADGDADFPREGVRVLTSALMEAEVTELTGVPKGERAPERRLTNRNGYRERRWDTRVGTIDLAIPKVRDGRYFPSLLEPRRRAERALLAVVCEAYAAGVSTRRAEDLVAALGVSSMSKSEVSRICAALDAEVEAFRSHSLGGELYPYLWLDATYVKVRDGGRVVSMAALVAIGVAASGERRVLGLELAAGNDEGNAWAPFLGRLIERGLAGVRKVISDAHRGLVRAVDEMLLGASWQRCRVHFTHKAQSLAPRNSASMVATVIRSIFEQPGAMSAAEQLRRVAEGLVPRFPAVAELLRSADVDLLAHFHIPCLAPSPDPQCQPSGATQQGNQAPDERGRHLPDPGEPHPSGRDRPRRARRRVAGRPVLLQPGVDDAD
jgi:putative transposase